jgi:hypothetical protein
MRANTPQISITGLFGVKPALFARRVDTVRRPRRRPLADCAAMLADQEHHRRIARVIVDAGEERVAALDPVHEALGGEEIERAVDRDRRRPRPAGAATRSMISYAPSGLWLARAPPARAGASRSAARRA